MEIRFFSFSKKVNSTAIPTGTASGTYQIQLKDDTSLMNPTIIMRKSDFNFSWNYAYIPLWDRYYRVGDPRITAGHMIEIPLSEDVLASNKSDILSQSVYIEYCADSTEVYIPDNRLTTDNRTVISVHQATPAYLSDTEYTYVVSTIGTGSSRNPYTQIYVADSSTAVKALADKLYHTLTGDPLDDIVKRFSDASNCVVSIYKLPISLTAGRGDIVNSTMVLGNYDTEIPFFEPVRTEYKEQIEITIPKTHNDFRILAPWTTYRLYLPYVGIVDISNNDIALNNTMYIDILYSIRTRQISYAIRQSSTGPILAMYTAQFGYTIPTSTYQSDASGVVRASIGVAGGVAGIVAGKEMAVASTIASALNLAQSAFTKTASMSGDYNGAGVEKFGLKPTLIVGENNTVVTPESIASTMGRPYCKVDTLSNHSGFVKCINASVTIAVNEGELEEINNLLNTGVFIE